ncbi:MAG: hypothetical protein QW717_06140 [Candidatus Bathyarchaeia archaeon]
MSGKEKLDEYIARIEEACGAEKDFIVFFKYEKRDEAIARILKKARLERKIAGIIFDLTYNNISIRLYGTGKAIFKKIKEKNELNKVLNELML